MSAPCLSVLWVPQKHKTFSRNLPPIWLHKCSSPQPLLQQEVHNVNYIFLHLKRLWISLRWIMSQGSVWARTSRTSFCRPCKRTDRPRSREFCLNSSSTNPRYRKVRLSSTVISRRIPLHLNMRTPPMPSFLPLTTKWAECRKRTNT